MLLLASGIFRNDGVAHIVERCLWVLSSAGHCPGRQGKVRKLFNAKHLSLYTHRSILLRPSVTSLNFVFREFRISYEKVFSFYPHNLKFRYSCDISSVTFYRQTITIVHPSTLFCVLCSLCIRYRPPRWPLRTVDGRRSRNCPSCCPPCPYRCWTTHY